MACFMTHAWPALVCSGPERRLAATPAADVLHSGGSALPLLPGGWLEGTDARGMHTRLPPPVPDFVGCVKHQLASLRGAPSSTAGPHSMPETLIPSVHCFCAYRLLLAVLVCWWHGDGCCLAQAGRQRRRQSSAQCITAMSCLPWRQTPLLQRGAAADPLRLRCSSRPQAACLRLQRPPRPRLLLKPAWRQLSTQHLTRHQKSEQMCRAL